MTIHKEKDYYEYITTPTIGDDVMRKSRIKFTDKDIKRIRSSYPKYTIVQLAIKEDCSQSHIWNIVSNKIYVDPKYNAPVKGTRRKGASHHMSKFTIAEVVEIRSLRGKLSPLELAEKFHTTICTIGNILNDKSYLEDIYYPQERK